METKQFHKVRNILLYLNDTLLLVFALKTPFKYEIAILYFVVKSHFSEI